MTTDPQLSLRGLALLRTFRAAFEAAAEHSKAHPHEVAIIAEACASHLRSWQPMALLGGAADIEPATEITVAAIDGRIEVSISGECVCIYAFDSSAHDAAPLLTRAQAEELRTAIARVMATGKEAA